MFYILKFSVQLLTEFKNEKYNCVKALYIYLKNLKNLNYKIQ